MREVRVAQVMAGPTAAAAAAVQKVADSEVEAARVTAEEAAAEKADCQKLDNASPAQVDRLPKAASTARHQCASTPVCT